jgi:hypothetical protein
MSTELELIAARVTLLEDVVNSVQVALTNVASVEAVNQILLIVQKDIQDLQTDITQLRAEFELVKAEVFS